LQRKKEKKKGTEAFPSSVYNMTKDEQIAKITSLTEQFLTDDMFLVNIGIKPTNNVKVYIDADSGLGIERCIKVNRALYKAIEESGMYPEGDFSLEVSSPGVDEPLKNIRQFKKNVGRSVEVTLKEEGGVKEGVLKEATEEHLVLEITTGKNKKAVTTEETIPMNSILKTIVQIKF
jgi:ribosome maturation factor RimP